MWEEVEAILQYEGLLVCPMMLKLTAASGISRSGRVQLHSPLNLVATFITAAPTASLIIMAGHRAQQRLKALLRKLIGKTETAVMPPIPPTPLAAQRVFVVAELLEQILTHFSVTPLAVVRRVCRDWNNTILTTNSLRQISFLDPSTADESRDGLVQRGSTSQAPQKVSIFASMHPAIAAFFISTCFTYPADEEHEILCFQAEDFAEWLEQHPYLKQVLFTIIPLRAARHTLPTYGVWTPFRHQCSFLTASDLCEDFAQLGLELDSQHRTVRGDSAHWMTVQMERSTVDSEIVDAVRAGVGSLSWYEFSYTPTPEAGVLVAPNVAGVDALEIEASEPLTSPEGDAVQSSGKEEDGQLKEAFEVLTRLAVVECEKVRRNLASGAETFGDCSEDVKKMSRGKKLLMKLRTMLGGS